LAPVADWAATVQEGELVELAWVVVEFLALVRFRVMSSEVETSLAAIYNINQRPDINIERLTRSSPDSLAATLPA
jgi:hypothetical protein